MVMVRWNLDEMGRVLQRLDAERRSLQTQREQMREQQSRVEVNWSSPAGQQYQARLRADMENLSGVIQQLEGQIASLRRVAGHYGAAENQIKAALSRLPR